jgi:predicted transcriptional regulator
MNKKTQNTLSALDIALAATSTVIGKQDGEFTINEYAQLVGRSHAAATQKLNTMVAHGKLSVRRGMSESMRITNFYGPPKEGGKP